MTHAALIVAHVGVALAKAKADLLDTFRVHDATAPERARPLSDMGVGADNTALVDFISTGVIRAVDARGKPVIIGDELSRPVGYYLDEVAYVANRDQKTRISNGALYVVWIAAGLLAVGAIALVLAA